MLEHISSAFHKSPVFYDSVQVGVVGLRDAMIDSFLRQVVSKTHILSSTITMQPLNLASKLAL